MFLRSFVKINLLFRIMDPLKRKSPVSKIHENRFKQTCKLIQVLGTLYRYIQFTAVLDRPYFTCFYENSIILLS